MHVIGQGGPTGGSHNPGVAVSGGGQITAGASGTASGTVSYSVDANVGPARTGTITAGSLSTTIQVPILHDTLSEGLERFRVRITGVTGAAPLRGAAEEAIVTIVDNDPSARIGRAPRR